jgi:type IV secretion system protein VirB8
VASTNKTPQRQSSDWYADRYQQALVQRNVLLFICALALAAAAFAAFAIYSMAPLKTVEPYLIKIDEKSGIIQKVEPVSRNQYAANEAVDRYFISRYVLAREGYNPTTQRIDANIVRVTSVPDVFNTYRLQADPNNPASVAATLRQTGIRQAEITSISYIENPAIRGNAATTPTKIMQVRFTTHDAASATGGSKIAWVATIAFEYASLNLTEEEKLINPIGFTVTSYQVQKEFN